MRNSYETGGRENRIPGNYHPPGVAIPNRKGEPGVVKVGEPFSLPLGGEGNEPNRRGSFFSQGEGEEGRKETQSFFSKEGERKGRKCSVYSRRREERGRAGCGDLTDAHSC